METSLYHQFAAIEDSHWWFVARRTILRKLLDHWLPLAPERRILDVGCGCGGMVKLLQQFGHVEGIDLSPDALAYCRRRHGEAVQFHQGSLPDGMPDTGPYDVVTAFDVIEHIPDSVGALRGIRNHLAPNGLLFVTVPALMLLWGPHDELNLHQRRYTAGGLESELEAAGFSVVWTSYFNAFLFPPICAIRVLRRLGGRRLPASDFGPVPRPLNRLLQSIFAAEGGLLPTFRLPVGVSLAAVARPRDEGS